MNAVRAYECRAGQENWSKTIHAINAGKARYQFLIDLRDAGWDVSFKDIKVKSCGCPRTSDDFMRTARRRNVQFARIGMRVSVDGERGLIVGVNSSDNFDVFFESGRFSGQTLNCHPNWRMEYFDANGNEIERTKGCTT